jgi:WD40 repeat protein
MYCARGARIIGNGAIAVMFTGLTAACCLGCTKAPSPINTTSANNFISTPAPLPVDKRPDAPATAELRVLNGSNLAVFLPDGKQAVTKSGVLWHLQTGQEKKLLKLGPRMQITDFAFLPDKRRVLTSDLDHQLHLWDLQTGEELKTYKGHDGNVNCVAVAPDGRLAASGGFSDKSLRLWDVEAGEGRGVLGTFSHSVGYVAFTPSGKELHADHGAGIRRHHEDTVGRREL